MQSKQSWQQNSQEMLWGNWIVPSIILGSHGDPKSRGQSRALRGGRISHQETHTRLQPQLATLLTSKKVTPNTGYFKVLCQTGLTHFGGCTFSVCWRQGSFLVHLMRHKWEHWPSITNMARMGEEQYLYDLPLKRCQAGARNLMATTAATAHKEKPQTCARARQESRAIPREEQEKLTWKRCHLAWFAQVLETTCA